MSFAYDSVLQIFGDEFKKLPQDENSFLTILNQKHKTLKSLNKLFGISQATMEE